MKTLELIAKYSHVRAELGIDDIIPGDVCKLSCPEEGTEYILIAVPKSEGPRCSRCAVKQNLEISTCYVGCHRRGFYFKQIDNVPEAL